MSTRIVFLKGYGTENDFVIVPDPENAVDLPPAAVAALCDRRAGLGGDGLLHVVRSAAHPEARGMAAEAESFMDYRNGDGSVAEMCGNGVRVFARYLQRAGHAAEGDLAIATRGGVKRVHIAKSASDGGDAAGDVTVGMGRAVLPEGDVEVSVGERSWPARNANMGNPHAVAFVADLAHAGDLYAPPSHAPAGAYPDGATSSSWSTGAPATSRCASTSAAPVRPVPAAPARVPSPSPPRAGTVPIRRSPVSRRRTPSTCPAAPW
ncbi:Diaminopimelate epimerase [Streptomyces tendae]